MNDALGIGVLIIVFILPCAFLAMAIRHFVPLVRGFQAPRRAYALGPIAFASDRYFSEFARTHRKPFLRLVSAFILASLVLLAVASGGLA